MNKNEPVRVYAQKDKYRRLQAKLKIQGSDVSKWFRALMDIELGENLPNRSIDQPNQDTRAKMGSETAAEYLAKG